MNANRIRKISLNKGVLTIILVISDMQPLAGAGLCLNTDQEYKEIPFELKKAGNHYKMQIRFMSGVWPGKQDAAIELSEGDWIVFVRFSDNSSHIFLALNNHMRMMLLMKGMRLYLPGGKILFPMAGDENRLILRCRSQAFYDSGYVWWKERFSFVLCTILLRLKGPAGTCVVFEKFCSQAQDNGAAFFTYCMQHLEGKERKRFVYILDRKSPASFVSITVM